MSKFLRMIESSLPSEDQTNRTLTSNSVLMDITDSIRNLNLTYFIKPKRPSNPAMTGDVKETGIVYVNDTPKFKITITPIGSEDAEDADIIGGGIKTSTKYGPGARVAADKLAQTATRRFSDVEKELNSRKPKANII